MTGPSQITQRASAQNSADDAGHNPLAHGKRGKVVRSHGPHAVQHIAVLSVEVHANSTNNKLPNPDGLGGQGQGKVMVICFWVQDDTFSVGSQYGDGTTLLGSEGGVIVVQPETCSEQGAAHGLGMGQGVWVKAVPDEVALFVEFVRVVEVLNPDIIIGYDILRGSLGYLMERAAVIQAKTALPGVKQAIALETKLSRAPDEPKHEKHRNDSWGAERGSDIWLVGRIVLNVWRILRSEVKHGRYDFEDMALHLLDERQPRFTTRDLNGWFKGTGAGVPGGGRTKQKVGGVDPHPLRWRTLRYYLLRARGSLRMFEQLDLVGSTSEMARLFGIDFYSVLTRGSQYVFITVENLLLLYSFSSWHIW